LASFRKMRWRKPGLTPTGFWCRIAGAPSFILVDEESGSAPFYGNAIPG
jgi:hypothetical protein